VAAVARKVNVRVYILIRDGLVGRYSYLFLDSAIGSNPSVVGRDS
jgi:hypothetical protein